MSRNPFLQPALPQIQWGTGDIGQVVQGDVVPNSPGNPFLDEFLEAANLVGIPVVRNYLEMNST